ncbi:MAG: STAS domain-containing protein [Blautia sp.]|nr:STAS domain-containing protein [Blautia sp.]
MLIDKQLNGTTMNLTLIGRLDLSTAPLLEKELKNSLEGVTELIIDMKYLDYISSTGLRILLQAHNKMAKDGSMLIRNPNKIVMEVFRVTGFDHFLQFEDRAV